MRSETASAWIIASLCVLTIGLALFVFDGPDNFTGLLGAMGAYFAIAVVVILAHDRRMAKRTRAGRE